MEDSFLERRLRNSKGEVYFGMHFYSGLAEYQEPDGSAYRVYLNEDTIRSMDPSFTGRPIFVDHVDGVDQDLDSLKNEVDGWVLRSFYNEADGKHWVEFIITSERGKSAIQSGMRLSNAYLPHSFKPGGLWNGISYQKEITGGEYEHLAIVKNPRYDESVILTREEFKSYNQSQLQELKKMSNSLLNKENRKMGLNFFKRTRVENAIDPELCITLPKSKVEKSIQQLINEADAKEADMNSGLADMSHKVKMKDNSYCNVGALLEKYNKMCDEMESAKKENGEEEELDEKKKKVEVEGDEAKKDNDDDSQSMDNAEDDEDEEKKKKNKDQMDEKLDDEKKKSNALQKKYLDKFKADALRNAKAEWIKEEQEKLYNSSSEPSVLLPSDKIALGKKMFGSKKYQ